VRDQVSHPYKVELYTFYLKYFSMCWIFNSDISDRGFRFGPRFLSRSEELCLSVKTGAKYSCTLSRP
jgi:hypothetical protein